jgi:hypothetical protein
MKNYCLEYQVKLGKENFLSSGMFTKAYRLGEKVILLSRDNAKECLAIFCQVGNKHIPICERLEDINGENAFEMPFYNPLKAENKIAWYQYKQVKKAIDSMPWEDRQKYKCFEGYKKAFENCDIPETLKEALDILVSEMQNYTDHIFLEISPRNAKVDSEGNLILLDIIGDSVELDKIRKRRQNKF